MTTIQHSTAYLVMKSPRVLVQLLKSELLVERSFVFLSHDTTHRIDKLRRNFYYTG